MKEYIEREAVLQFPIRKDHCDKEHANKHFIFGVESVMEYVENLPAADVAEVRHGRWELYGNDDDLGSSYFCSVCHSSFDEDWFYNHNKFRPFKFCPNCSARMGEEAEQDAN